jgi:hypothetical protein
MPRRTRPANSGQQRKREIPKLRGFRYLGRGSIQCGCGCSRKFLTDESARDHRRDAHGVRGA